MTYPPVPVPTPSDLTMKRLGYVRLLYGQAITQSHTPAPLNFSAILGFHDVCEYFFAIAVDALRTLHDNASIDLRSESFDTNLNRKLRAPDGKHLQARDAVRRIASYRDAFKHNGAIPSPDQIEQARRDAVDFLEQNCPRLFGIQFSDISMLHIVSQDNVRTHLQAGRVAADAGKLDDAMGEVALAFDTLMSEWGSGKRVGGESFEYSSFELGRTWRSHHRRIEIGPGGSDDSRRVAKGLAASVKEAFTDMDREIEALRRIVRAQISGMNMVGYVRFKMLAPNIVYFTSGNRQPLPNGMSFHYTPENYEFCESFVVESALRIAQFDFSIWTPRTYGDARRAEAAAKANDGILPGGFA